MANYTKQSYELTGDLKLLEFLAGDLNLSCLGLALGRIPPGEGWGFFHTHKLQEEVYVCLDGTMTMIIDGDAVAMQAGDMVRVPPEASRAVGNRTNLAATVLIMGAMPFEGHQDPDRPSKINDGLLAKDEPAPDWTVTA